jgi:hypothetical protein
VRKLVKRRFQLSLFISRSGWAAQGLAVGAKLSHSQHLEPFQSFLERQLQALSPALHALQLT